MKLLGIFEHTFLMHAILAGLFAGFSCAITGVFLVITHLSFLGVCIAHAAFAGALFGLWLGIDPIVAAAIFSVATAVSIGPLADSGQLSPDASAGLLFSFMLGLAFLFMGLLPGSRTEALGLFWGGLFTVTRAELVALGAIAFLTGTLLYLFYKEILAVMCHRRLATAVGIPATLVFYAALIWSAITVAASLRIVGGLLVYSLLVNPAAAAYQISRRLRYIFLLSAMFGVLSCWMGLFFSYRWDLPAGASIVLVSTLIYAVCLFVTHRRNVIS